MTHEAKWASQPWEKVEELMSSPKGALHEIGRLRKRVNELLESNNAYQQAYRDAKDLTKQGVAAVEDMLEHHASQSATYEKQIEELRASLDDAERVGAALTDSAHYRAYEIERTKTELAAAGHEFEGDPLHILVDKAIDKERERHQETIVKISTKLGIVFAAGSSYESQADAICADIEKIKDELKATGHQFHGETMDVLVSRAIDKERGRHEASISKIAKKLGLMLDAKNSSEEDADKICEAIGRRKGWTVYPFGAPEVAMEFKDVGPTPETVARNAEIEQIQVTLGRIVGTVDILNEKVEQLMARADNDDAFPDRYSAMMQKWLNDLERRCASPVDFSNLRRRR